MAFAANAFLTLLGDMLIIPEISADDDAETIVTAFAVDVVDEAITV